MSKEMNLLQTLEYLDPITLDNDQWLNVGRALKSEGYTAADWEDWSRRDSARYKPGECFRHWASFVESDITGEFIREMAERGNTPINTVSSTYPSLSELFRKPAVEKPVLIEKVIRQGHNLMFVAPPKACKSFALMDLTIAIAEGLEWLGWQCKQGNVLYINLQLNETSMLERFKAIYQKMGISPTSLHQIDIHNLYGKSEPLHKLVDSILETSRNKSYAAIVIDPLDRLLIGYNAAETARQLDRLSAELGTSVISCCDKDFDLKQMDPAAVIELFEMEVNEKANQLQKAQITAQFYVEAIKRHNFSYYEERVGQDHEKSILEMTNHVKYALTTEIIDQVKAEVDKAVSKIATRSAWRVEGTLREFPKFEPFYVWFEYPRLEKDSVGILKDAQKNPTWKQNFALKKSPEEAKQARIDELTNVYEVCAANGEVTVKVLAEQLKVTEKTVRNRVKEHEGFIISDSKILKVE